MDDKVSLAVVGRVCNSERGGLVCEYLCLCVNETPFGKGKFERQIVATRDFTRHLVHG